MSDLVGNPEERFSRVEALIVPAVTPQNAKSHQRLLVFYLLREMSSKNKKKKIKSLLIPLKFNENSHLLIKMGKSHCSKMC